MSTERCDFTTNTWSCCLLKGHVCEHAPAASPVSESEPPAVLRAVSAACAYCGLLAVAHPVYTTGMRCDYFQPMRAAVSPLGGASSEEPPRAFTEEELRLLVEYDSGNIELSNRVVRQLAAALLRERTALEAAEADTRRIAAVQEPLGLAYRAVIENRWGDAQMLVAGIQYTLAADSQGASGPEEGKNDSH